MKISLGWEKVELPFESKKSQDHREMVLSLIDAFYGNGLSLLGAYREVE